MTPDRALMLRLLDVPTLPACWKRQIEAVLWPDKKETPAERDAMEEEAERMRCGR